VSRLGANERGFSPVLPLARPSLLGLSTMLFATSCIVADPPEYHDPVQSRPQLIVYRADPPTQQILLVDPNSSLGTNFNVPFRSEDSGEDLTGVFFLDYQVSPGERFQGSLNLTASTFDNTERAATFTWRPVGIEFGCHYLSLVVAHRSSFLDGDTIHLDKTKGEKDAAIVTWVVNIGPAAGQEHTLINCPVSTPPVK
jgi:hypothetical protein